MAWTSPRTWTTGELVTAANLNTHIRDQLNAISHYPMEFLLDEGGVVLSSGSAFEFIVPYDGTVAQWDVMADAASSVQVEIYSVSFAGAPPASEDSINSGSPIQTASTRYQQDTNPSSFGALTKGEVAQLNISGASGITKATVSLLVDRT